MDENDRGIDDIKTDFMIYQYRFNIKIHVVSLYFN